MLLPCTTCVYLTLPKRTVLLETVHVTQGQEHSGELQAQPAPAPYHAVSTTLPSHRTLSASGSDPGQQPVCGVPGPKPTATTLHISAAPQGHLHSLSALPVLPFSLNPLHSASVLPSSCNGQQGHPHPQTQCSLLRSAVGPLPLLTAPSRPRSRLRPGRPMVLGHHPPPVRPAPLLCLREGLCLNLSLTYPAGRVACLMEISEPNESEMELKPPPPATFKVSAEGSPLPPLFRKTRHHL